MCRQGVLIDVMRNRAETTVIGLDVDRIADVLDDAPVTVGVLYGSYARGDQHGRSDVDVAVGFETSMTPTERTRARLSLIARLSADLGTDDVDVVPLSGVSPEVLDEIREDGILVYGSPEDVDRFVDTAAATCDRGEALRTFDDVLDELGRVV